MSRLHLSPLPSETTIIVIIMNTKILKILGITETVFLKAVTIAVI